MGLSVVSGLFETGDRPMHNGTLYGRIESRRKELGVRREKGGGRRKAEDME
jgi:hypothetical protein